MALSSESQHALNAVCPYFTMFPLEFPLGILKRHRQARVVLDPFCGRGTTIYAARVRGMRGVGIDVSPVAVAISQAKVAYATTKETLALAGRLLKRRGELDVPTGEFWRLAFHKDTLREICRLRDSLLRLGVLTNEAALLRATALGVLHGPLTTTNSYLSNQMPRTFAAKPAYAVKFWKQKGHVPTRVPILHALGRKLALIESSVKRLRRERLDDIIIGNAATKDAFKHAPRLIDVVITSPPYYGHADVRARPMASELVLGWPL